MGRNKLPTNVTRSHRITFCLNADEHDRLITACQIQQVRQSRLIRDVVKTYVSLVVDPDETTE